MDWGLGCRANWKVSWPVCSSDLEFRVWDTVTFSHWSLVIEEETLSREKLRHFSPWLSHQQVTGGLVEEWWGPLACHHLPFSCFLVLWTFLFPLLPGRGKWWEPTQSFELELTSRWRVSTENGSNWRHLGPVFLEDIHYIRGFVGIRLHGMHNSGVTWPLSHSSYDPEEVVGGAMPQKHLVPGNITRV